LDQIHEAARRGGAARYPTNFAAGFAMLLSHVQAIRGGMRLLCLEAQVRAHRGDAAGAAESIRATFRLGGSLENEPVLISQLVRCACDAQGREQLRRLMGYVEFPAEDLALVQEELRAIRYDESLRQALLGERVLGAQAFTNPAGLTMQGPGVLWHLTRSSDYAYYQQIMSRLIAASRRPWPQARDDVAAIDAEIEAVKGGSPVTRWQRSMTLLTVPSLSHCFDAAARGTALNASADTAIAMELFRRRTGELPTRLDVLAPEYLPHVPLDPYDGKPLRLVIRPGEYVVYAVGTDEKDDGGQDDGSAAPDASFRVATP
jgi:hypothetical protein